MLRTILTACLLVLGTAQALVINVNETGYETPINALASIRDSTTLAADTAAYNATLPITLDWSATSDADPLNLKLWLNATHPNGSGTYDSQSQDTLRIGRVF
jgi:hypothetical protein